MESGKSAHVIHTAKSVKNNDSKPESEESKTFKFMSEVWKLGSRGGWFPNQKKAKGDRNWTT